MSDTPETDALDSKWDSYSHPFEAIELARKLERERNEARQALQTLTKELNKTKETLREIATASHFDNIGNWARNKAKKTLENSIL